MSLFVISYLDFAGVLLTTQRPEENYRTYSTGPEAEMLLRRKVLK